VGAGANGAGAIADGSATLLTLPLPAKAHPAILLETDMETADQRLEKLDRQA